MLSRLQVNNYVLIDSLDIEFPEGLVIITGQTGAGKSILMGALNLALGAKADASVIGTKGGNCVVEAEFAVGDLLKDIAGQLDENGVDAEDGRLVIRRVVNPTGRSRAFVNDSPVTLQFLSSLASRLVDIHSQHQTLMLSDRKFRLSSLDTYAGDSDLLDDFGSAYSELASLTERVTDLETSLRRALEERSYNEARFSQLDSAGLRQGEIEELEAEQKQLANAEEIKGTLCEAETLFFGGESDDSPGVDSMLKEIERCLEKISGFVSRAASLSERMSSCRVELDDIMSEISSLSSRTEISPERLQCVEDRLSLLYGLLQKFGCATVDELIAERDSLSSRLDDTAGMEGSLEELKAECASARARVNRLADALHEARAGAAPSFASAITDALRWLELPHAVFNVEVKPSELTSSGGDAVHFMFSATGKNPADVSKCASGGEFSRIMLALKAMMAKYMDMPTMVFDEIDTGVSGSVADRMGSMICEMGRDMQVFAITHLPQVAAKGNAHYLVSKEIDPETSDAVTTIRRLGDEERVMEVARMLSGSALTDAAVANARSLLRGE